MRDDGRPAEGALKIKIDERLRPGDTVVDQGGVVLAVRPRSTSGSSRLIDAPVALLGLLAPRPAPGRPSRSLVRVEAGPAGPLSSASPRPARRPFVIYKFRTMTRCAGRRTGACCPTPSGCAPFGRFLRSTSLDELPELWNVVKGEMSLVGPRPLRMSYLSRYTAEQARRHEVRPGLTGWAQVHGRNALPWNRKFELDLWYVRNVSLVLDLEILGRTLRALVVREGIAADGHATAPEFRGALKSRTEGTGP